METEGGIAFDELDQKIFNELPFLTDVMAAWGNKVARLLEPYHSEFEELISDSIKGKRFWRIHSTAKNTYYPLSEEKKFSQLEARMIVYNEFNIVKKIRNKSQKWFVLEYGYWMQAMADADYPPLNCFYFAFYQEELPKIEVAALKSVEFYKSLKATITDHEVDYNHPDDNRLDQEFIEFRCSQLDPLKIDQMKKDFIKNVLRPILKSIE